MFAKDQIIVGLEIGTSKVCAVVGEVREHGDLTIIGIGQAPSQGVRKGEIVDMEKAQECIHAAVVEAEESANVEIHNVYAGVSGGHIRCFDNHGNVPVASEDRDITEEDVRNVMRNARAVNIPVENVVIHAIRQNFYIDGHDDIENPVGMIGARLEVDVHIIHGIRSRLQNTIRCIKQVPLDVTNIAVSGFASGLAVLTTDQQQQGALVIDMGGGTTDYVVYREGVLQHSGVLAVGGDHITNDIATALRVPMNRADNLKVEHGSVEWPVEDTTIAMKREVGLPDLQLSRKQLCQVMNLRVEETLSLIRQELERKNLLQYLGSGVYITGGCARLQGLESLAAQVFNLPVRVSHGCTVAGPKAAIESPEYSTAIGLLRFGVSTSREQPQPQGTVGRVGQTFHALLRKVRAFL